MTRVRGRKGIRWWAGLLIALVAVVGALVLVNRQHSRPTSVSGSSLLVLTWAPSLCTVDSSVRGCRTGNVGRKGQAFLLHGLWPQPSSAQYCDVAKQDDRQRISDLPADLRDRLTATMSDASVLAPHEWSKHGTCSGVSAVEYFGIATTLSAQATAVLDPAVRDARGGRLSARSLRDLFDARFGAGSGGRITLACRRTDGQGEVVYEVRLSLPAVPDLRAAGSGVSLGEELAKAPTVPAGCGQARVP